MADLNTQREALIERIKQVFPKQRPVKDEEDLKLLEDYAASYSVSLLRKTFDGKLWEEVVKVSDPSLVYILSEVDHLRDITDEAYLYYLPAFLVATLKYPEKWVMYSMVIEKIREILSQVTLDQLDVLIAFFDFHARLLRSYPPLLGDEDSFLVELEEMQLRLMLRRDEF